MDIIEVSSQRRRQLIDITSFVDQVVAAAHMDEGICRVGVPHTTAAVLINENADPAVADDLLAGFEAMLPEVRWTHAEGNSDAHLLSSLVGPAITVPVSGGDLRLGRWQAIYLLELDGPRRREIWVSLVRS